MRQKVAIITGGSGGIGEATAKHLAKEGYAICVNYHEAHDKAHAIVKSITDQQGKAIAIQANVAVERDVIQLFQMVDECLGPVTALINNAGINGGITDVENISFDCLQKVFATNVFGTFLSAREAIKRMKANGGGGIVNISSEAAKFGGNKLAHYAASKAAINTFTIGLAREVAPYHIRVNTVSPGVIDTDIHKASPPERIQALKNSLPFGRMGTPNEVAETIAWLLSDKSSYLSGTVISITGAR